MDSRAGVVDDGAMRTLLVGLVALAACGGSSDPAAPPPDVKTDGTPDAATPVDNCTWLATGLYTMKGQLEPGQSSCPTVSETIEYDGSLPSLLGCKGESPKASDTIAKNRTTCTIEGSFDDLNPLTPLLGCGDFIVRIQASDSQRASGKVTKNGCVYMFTWTPF